MAHADDAADDFFAYLFENAVLPRADADRGRFRCFMQGVVRNYARSWRRSNSALGTDVDDLEVSQRTEEQSSDAEEESWWATSLLEKALASVRRTHPEEALLLQERYGLGTEEELSPEALASRHGKASNAVNQAVHRARKRLEERLLEEIHSLVESEADFEEERDLLLGRLLDARPGLFPVNRSANP